MCGARNLSKNKPLLLHPPFGLGEKTTKNFRHFSFFSTFSLFFCSKLERVRMKQNIKPTRVVKCSLARSPNSKWETTKPKPKKEMGKRERERGNNEERGESPNPPFHLQTSILLSLRQAWAYPLSISCAIPARGHTGICDQNRK